MPPVPVRIDDPITPTKAQAPPQQTAEQPAGSLANNATTTSQNGTPAYHPARPGAAAVPAPTPYIPQPPPEATRTQASAVAQNVPPPPQPGAVPMPPSQQASMNSPSTLPPPPKAGESLKQRQASVSNQMAIPPPDQNYGHTRSTSAYVPPTTTTSEYRGATTLNFGPVSSPPQAPHPPGYHQNTAAQEMSSAQRSSLEEQERKDGVFAQIGGDSAGETAASYWNAVKGWASTASEKLIETEETVWRKLNGR